MWAIPCYTKSASEVSKKLMNIYYTCWPPKFLQCNNSKEFKENVLEVCKKMKITIINGRARHPQTQGQVERANQTLKRFLSKINALDEEKKWVEILPRTVYRYNTSIHSAHNSTPFKIFYSCSGINEISATVNEESQEYYDEESDYRSKYYERMVRNTSPNTQASIIVVGSEVAIVKDIDINSRYKLTGMDTRCPEEIYVVTRIATHNNVYAKRKNFQENDLLIDRNRLIF